MSKSIVQSPPSRWVKKRIRVRKQDTAFVYCVFEAHEGITAYSTVPAQPGDSFRDLELGIPPDFVEEVEHVIASLGDLVYRLD